MPSSAESGRGRADFFGALAAGLPVQPSDPVAAGLDNRPLGRPSPLAAPGRHRQRLPRCRCFRPRSAVPGDSSRMESVEDYDSIVRVRGQPRSPHPVGSGAKVNEPDRSPTVRLDGLHREQRQAHQEHAEAIDLRPHPDHVHVAHRDILPGGRPERLIEEERIRNSVPRRGGTWGETSGSIAGTNGCAGDIGHVEVDGQGSLGPADQERHRQG